MRISDPEVARQYPKRAGAGLLCFQMVREPAIQFGGKLLLNSGTHIADDCGGGPMSLGCKPGFLLLPVLVLSLAVPGGFAKDKEVRIPLPRRNHATPVQNLNREGVKALEKHDYGKAKNLFYQAYLLDPDDPFTLNNLGYVAELEGEVERAKRF